MKNFPSSLIRQQNTKNGLGNNLKDTLSNIGTKALSSLFNGGSSGTDSKDMTDSFEPGLVRPELSQMLEGVNIFEQKDETVKIQNNYNSSINFQYNYQNGKDSIDNISFEDPFKFSSTIFSVINNYKYVFNYLVPSLRDIGGYTDSKNKDDDHFGMAFVNTIVSPSLFNPFVGIDVTGITENIPLINRGSSSISSSQDINSGLSDNDKSKLNGDEAKMTFNSQIYGDGQEKDLSDCSIRKLVQLSNDGKMGSETYRYQDFMYCKDLGKIPNNRLITLRRFPAPVGDNIYDSEICGIHDNGRLITWFDNEDNKLENICKYDYRASWKQFTAAIQQKQAEDQDNGMLSQLANFLSPENNILTSKGFSGNNGLLAKSASMLHIPLISGENASKQYYSLETLTNYDEHKIYEPTNRISSMYQYEGNLEFNQEITLVFRYVLRSYDNINPRAAMMDLLGNIMTVTYTKGKFWGGESKIYGPQGNKSVYNKVNNIIDKAWDEMGSIWSSLESGKFDLSDIMGWLSNMLDQGKAILNQAKTEAQGALEHPKETGKKAVEATGEAAKNVMPKLSALNKKYHWSSAIKGMLKNQLGRPAIYAFNSLLTGEDNGLWHLTIGNPRNPIMSIGNLIIDSPAIVQHYGPLGLDDFPTEMSVTVTLKHQRPRDRVDIEKMYTKGRRAIYNPMNLLDISKYYKSPAFGDLLNIDNTEEALKVNLGNI